LLRGGDWEVAEAELEDAFARLEQLVGLDHTVTQEAVEVLVDLYESRGDAEQALDWRGQRSHP
jgi:hypothetical protein